MDLFETVRDKLGCVYGKKMYGADKDVIISFLKQAP